MQKCAEAVAVWLVRCQVIEEQEKNYIATQWKAL